MSLLLTLENFHTFFSVSIVDLEQLNMFVGTILDLSSGNDDVVFFDFLWHIINTIYFNVVGCCNLRNYILLTFVNIKSLSVPQID